MILPYSSGGGGGGGGGYPGVTADGLIPAGLIVAGRITADNLPGTASYAYVSQNAGQVYASGSFANLTIDTITHLSAEYTAIIGQDHVTIIKPGIYLVIEDSYIAGTPLASGVLRCIVNAGTSLLSSGITCPADISDTSEALAIGLLSVPDDSGSDVAIRVTQSDTVDRTVAGDLVIIRLPGSVV